MNKQPTESRVTEIMTGLQSAGVSVSKVIAEGRRITFMVDNDARVEVDTGFDLVDMKR